MEKTGENLRIKNIIEKNYWEVNTHAVKASDIEEELFAVHKNAVEIRTRSDVPIGLLLSGGLDSSTLTAEVSELFRAKGLNPADINTFTTCWKDFPQGDEWGFADSTNRFCGVTGHAVYPETDDSLQSYKDAIWHNEGQTAIGGLGSFLTLKEIAKYHIKVMFNGQGSDETMFGYERYYAWYLKDILKKSGPAAFASSFHKAVANSVLSRKQLLEYLFYFNNYHLRKAYRAKKISPIATAYLMDIFKRQDSVRELVSFSSLADLQYNELRRTQLTHILRGDDRSYMAYSMESRVPFIDYRYIELACRLPEEDKIQKGYTKYPLRKYINGRLPDDVVWRKNKMGWPSPRKKWIDGFNREAVEDLFQNSRGDKYFNIKNVKNLFESNPYDESVEQFLNTEIFMSLFDTCCM